MSAALDCSGMTHCGRVRKNNEDQFLIADLTKQVRLLQTSMPDLETAEWSRSSMGYLFMVADGMGGVAGGELASGLAVETISWYVAKTMPWFYRFQDGREGELEAELRGAVEACHQTVANAAKESNFRRMGTTLTLAYVLWPRVYVIHAGDSRCYLRRGDRLHQMTHDHTVAQRVVDQGLLTADEAEKAGLGHQLWNCIGGGTHGVTPETYKATLETGDELLLCTDGLTRRLKDDELLSILKQAPTAEAATRSLIQAANEAGGEDNVTAIVARTRPARDPSRTPIDGTRFLPGN